MNENKIPTHISDVLCCNREAFEKTVKACCERALGGYFGQKFSVCFDPDADGSEENPILWEAADYEDSYRGIILTTFDGGDDGEIEDMMDKDKWGDAACETVEEAVSIIVDDMLDIEHCWHEALSVAEERDKEAAYEAKSAADDAAYWKRLRDDPDFAEQEEKRIAKEREEEERLWEDEET